MCDLFWYISFTILQIHLEYSKSKVAQKCYLLLLLPSLHERPILVENIFWLIPAGYTWSLNLILYYLCIIANLSTSTQISKKQFKVSEHVVPNEFFGLSYSGRHLNHLFWVAHNFCFNISFVTFTKGGSIQSILLPIC